MIAHRTGLTYGAFLFIFINGINLLPVLPLDGGRFLHATLFSRNRWLEPRLPHSRIVG